jgi:hypothetical protein
MERNIYLQLENYLELHEFLNSIIYRAEIISSAFILKKGYQNHQLEKKLSSARIVKNSVTYDLSFTFFEDAQEHHFKENDVCFLVEVTLLEDDQFTIQTCIESIYELKNYPKYYNLTELSEEAKNDLLQVPADFEALLKRFFEKALDRFGNPDEMHTRLQREEDLPSLS